MDEDATLGFLQLVEYDQAHFGGRAIFEVIIEALEKEGVSFEVKEQRNLEDSDLLTSRQEQILSIAFEMGYFDFPKKAGLKELADQTGIKTSTLGEIMRRGQKKILGEYLAKRSLLHGNRD